MADQVFTLPKPPKIKSGREIYDSIMGQIEPELVSSSIPLLKKKYANETPEQKAARKKRYNAAYKKYDEMYEIYLADLDARISRYYKESMSSIEEQSRKGEEQKLNDIAAAMFKLA